MGSSRNTRWMWRVSCSESMIFSPSDEPGVSIECVMDFPMPLSIVKDAPWPTTLLILESGWSLWRSKISNLSGRQSLSQEHPYNSLSTWPQGAAFVLYVILESRSIDLGWWWWFLFYLAAPTYIGPRTSSVCIIIDVNVLMHDTAQFSVGCSNISIAEIDVSKPEGKQICSPPIERGWWARSQSSLDGILSFFTFLGMTVSSLTMDPLNSSVYTMTVSWTPRASQLGANLVCYTPVSPCSHVMWSSMDFLASDGYPWSTRSTGLYQLLCDRQSISSVCIWLCQW